MRSPWGVVQVVEKIAEGIICVHTAGHGGLKLDRKRNSLMPSYMRNRGGYYEEDCEWAKVAVVFPAHFTDDSLLHAKKTLLNYYPDEYERFYDVEIKSGESYARDEKHFREFYRNDWIAVGACGDWKEGVPKGFVHVTAERRGKRKNFLVPQADYDKRSQHGYVVDLKKDKETDLT